jgi:hypothetical protein
MWRVILRISFTHDAQSRLRNHLVPLFEAMGLHRTATGTWETPASDRTTVATQLSQVLEILANPQQHVPEVDAQSILNHLWVYIDRVLPEQTEGS